MFSGHNINKNTSFKESIIKYYESLNYNISSQTYDMTKQYNVH